MWNGLKTRVRRVFADAALSSKVIYRKRFSLFWEATRSGSWPAAKLTLSFKKAFRLQRWLVGYNPNCTIHSLTIGRVLVPAPVWVAALCDRSTLHLGSGQLTKYLQAGAHYSIFCRCENDRQWLHAFNRRFQSLNACRLKATTRTENQLSRHRKSRTTRTSRMYG